MSETGGIVQPDGRVVFGPPLPEQAPERASAYPFLLVCLWVLSIGAAGLLGHYSTPRGPSHHELIRDSFLERGCAPFFAASPATPEQEDQLRTGVQGFAQGQEAAGLGSVEHGVYDVPKDSPLRDDYPGIEFLGIVTWERCEP